MNESRKLISIFIITAFILQLVAPLAIANEPTSINQSETPFKSALSNPNSADENNMPSQNMLQNSPISAAPASESGFKVENLVLPQNSIIKNVNITKDGITWETTPPSSDSIRYHVNGGTWISDSKKEGAFSFNSTHSRQMPLIAGDYVIEISSFLNTMGFANSTLKFKISNSDSIPVTPIPNPTAPTTPTPSTPTVPTVPAPMIPTVPTTPTPTVPTPEPSDSILLTPSSQAPNSYRVVSNTISNMRMTKLSDSSVKLEWTTDHINFDAYYKTKNGEWQRILINSQIGKNRSTIVDNLSPNVAYDFWVGSYYGDNWDKVTSGTYFFTLDGPVATTPTPSVPTIPVPPAPEPTVPTIPTTPAPTIPTPPTPTVPEIATGSQEHPTNDVLVKVHSTDVIYGTNFSKTPGVEIDFWLNDFLPTELILEYRVAGSTTWKLGAELGSVSQAANRYFVTLSYDISLNTLYDFRITVKNQNGKLSTINSQFKTPTSIDLNARVLGLSLDGAMLTHRSAAISYYSKERDAQVQYRAAGENDWQILDSKYIGGDSNNNYSAQIVGLNEQTKYEYRVIYQEGQLKSELKTFTTIAKPEHIISSPIISAGTLNGDNFAILPAVQINFIVNDLFREMRFELYNESTGNWDLSKAQGPYYPFSAHQNGAKILNSFLEAGKTYRYRIVGIDLIGNESVSKEFTFTAPGGTPAPTIPANPVVPTTPAVPTTPKVPPAPEVMVVAETVSNMETVDLTETSVKIEWNSDYINSDSEYMHDDMVGRGYVQYVPNTTKRFVTLTDLTPNTTYQFVVYSYQGDDWKKVKSRTFTFRTRPRSA